MEAIHNSFDQELVECLLEQTSCWSWKHTEGWLTLSAPFQKKRPRTEMDADIVSANYLTACTKSIEQGNQVLFTDTPRLSKFA